MLFAVILHPTDRYNSRYSFAAGLVLRTISIIYKKKKKKKKKYNYSDNCSLPI